MQMKAQRYLHKRSESLQMEECSLGTESETHNQRLEDKAAGDVDTWASTKVWTSRQ